MAKTGKEVFLVSKQEGRIARVPGVDIIRGLASFRCASRCSVSHLGSRLPPTGHMFSREFSTCMRVVFVFLPLLYPKMSTAIPLFSPTLSSSSRWGLQSLQDFGNDRTAGVLPEEDGGLLH